MTNETMNFDVLIVGAGPAGLSAAIRLAQLNEAQGTDLSICIIEKGASVGAHTLSGAVLEPRALDELLPDWQDRNAPINIPVTQDQFWFLDEKKAYRLPLPRPMKNHGNYIVRLGAVCAWLAEQAESLGVDIFPGFAGSEVLYDGDKVIGVATGDMGVNREGEKTDQYQAGIHLLAKQTLFSEGCRGSLTQTLFKRFNLREKVSPQTYGLGIKEVWEVDPAQHREGLVVHTIGWPLDKKTYGGSFIYHLDKHQVAIGFVTGLDYENPYLSPFEEMQRLKTHPYLKVLFQGGKRIAYGARALNEGGFQSIPQLAFPGGMIVGCAAGFLNVPKIKGTHTAMKSGMVAAEETFKALKTQTITVPYQKALKKTWVWPELKAVRNIRPAFRRGLWFGLCYAAIETYLFRGRIPWTFRHVADHTTLKKADNFKPIDYPKPDGVLTFDKLSSVFLSGTHHKEDQKVHLQLETTANTVVINHALYQSPETRYCPAGVYEVFMHEGHPKLQINAQNCIHCKTCDIKDPTQNIVWHVPEGGGGPQYSDL